MNSVEENSTEYPESIDSEKSSSESQASPRKIEGNELESSTETHSNTKGVSCGESDKVSASIHCADDDLTPQSLQNGHCSCDTNSAMSSN